MLLRRTGAFNCLILLTVLFQDTVAKKGGRRRQPEISPNILNPDPAALANPTPLLPLEYSAKDSLLEGDIMGAVNPHPDDRTPWNFQLKLWPRGRVPYRFASGLDKGVEQTFRQAAKDLAEHTCIRFIAQNESNSAGGETSVVQIRANQGADAECQASLGAQSSPVMQLHSPGCDSKGAILHLMMHILGLYHESSRPVRDQHVSIQWGKLKSGAGVKDVFQKRSKDQPDLQAFPYDVDSVTHFHPKAMSKDGRSLTMLAKDPSKQIRLGQRAGLSKGDVEKLNKLYKCPPKAAN